jgi:hypothetical protein
MVNPRKLSLKREDNQAYYSIIDGHNNLMDNWNNINKELYDLRQPKVLFWGHKKKLKKVGISLLELQKQFLEWNKQASQMIFDPHLIFQANEESELGFLHYSGILRDLRNKVDNHMVLIVDNYNRERDNHTNQVNFVIAIASFVLTFLGLAATIWTIWK